ncbi:alpha/beta hydrolase family protein [Isoptericola jiangsuensis]|uniref:Alpha/beta hydrolase family protein n=1 Tax=Isoptericola jiangsuensis TaxID=548579 RepID=A0A2A9ETW5_9MICO|nr:alpha/beta hydrolase [Isoptericola jiangsuensis]PFG42016.1 alpha/beta hydrolase family protein [Isoptericola jiangsuensis]
MADVVSEREEPVVAQDRPGWWTWTVRAVAAAGLVVVAWVLLTGWGAVVHGHPLYAVLLALTVVGCGVALWRAARPRTPRAGWRRVLGVVGLVAAVAWVALVAWLRPFTAEQPALDAMTSDDAVTVTESATRIELEPAGGGDATALLFQPGAKVEARAYAAVLRPVAEAGHTVVVVKQPLGIGFLSTGALDAARAARPDVERWVVGGHSLGGVVAATEVDAADSDAVAPAAGLLLYASYPAGDVSGTLTAPVASVSGSQDGLSTPAKVEASRADLPPDATFTVVDGAVHAFFGDYGPQPGDGSPTIPHDDARAQISAATVAFVDEVAG